ncbi:hypothetical protein TWF506_007497 [Arthrobotrys conoides]|uniref:LysM domain-containing protein n=1 Tax=Arthrobotrys conoides TaxID=74498 RepID=A0AAN8NEQ2_9PEZI
MRKALAFVATAATFLLVDAYGGAAYYKRQEAPPGPTASGTTQYCTYYALGEDGVTCADIYSSWGITSAQFLRWNPSVGSPCTLVTGNAYCVEAANEPAPTTTTTTTTTTKSTTVISTTPGAPGPTQSGQSTLCDRWDLVNSGDSCGSFTSKYSGLTVPLLFSWNPAIASDCSNLWVGTYLCTRIKGWTPPTTTSKPPVTTTTGNGINTPTPTQPQMVSNCNKWYFVNTGDTCAVITSKTGATLAQLFAWNASIKSDCSGLWASVYICVGTTTVTPTTTKPPTTTTKATTTGNGVSTPTPIQTGMVKNCKDFKLVQSGDTCAAIISKYGITQAQLVSWNPAIKSDCTGLWAQYYICVRLIGMATTTTTKKTTTTSKKPTTTGNGVTTPSPIQTGMTKNCKGFRYVQGDDSCANIQTRFKITFQQLYSWNPAIGSKCEALWLKYYVCVAVLP